MQKTSCALIESDSFPIGFLSQLAEKESWRKEIHRPIYHLHKWWAMRLGSVFRGAILGCLLPDHADLADNFYRTQDFHDTVILDPFMGSGTTLGEAIKVGATALGKDINPVAAESVRVALGPLDRRALCEVYQQLSSSVGERIRALYKSTDDEGARCDVLYYFWVMQAPCPDCGTDNDLFSSRVIARNAYPKRRPEIQVCCPICGHVFESRCDVSNPRCPDCSSHFQSEKGLSAGRDCTCRGCSRVFRVSEAIRTRGQVPDFRLYAKLLLKPDGTKRYLASSLADSRSYQEASIQLPEDERAGRLVIPSDNLAEGFNTRQAMGYNFRRWRDFFNDRQLLALGWLQSAIADLPTGPTRDAMLLLFSGALEFNNRFTSYKGEGTGAVRHMFAHHILKPERLPIEGNVWGTPKSSGSFSSLFRSRLLRVMDYKLAPTEVSLEARGAGKQCSLAMAVKTSMCLSEEKFSADTVYLSCGDSAELDLPEKCVDYVITDPPFFDNVHYSELADFFFSWQRLVPRGFINGAGSTRDVDEVQDTVEENFAGKLRRVFQECKRVLRDDGLLVFSYHHARAEGWTAIAKAVYGAGFWVVNAQPVRSEMSVAAPKRQAKEPIQLDVLLVCRKVRDNVVREMEPAAVLSVAYQRSKVKAQALSSAGFKLSRNDCLVIVGSEVLRSIGCALEPQAMKTFSAVSDSLRDTSRKLCQENALVSDRVSVLAEEKDLRSQRKLPI